MPPCLTLSNIRYGSRVKLSNPWKGVAPSPTPWCSKLSKRELSGHSRLWSPTLLTYPWEKGITKSFTFGLLPLGKGYKEIVYFWTVTLGKGVLRNRLLLDCFHWERGITKSFTFELLPLGKGYKNIVHFWTITHWKGL